ncbi:NAD(P)-dependent oxidoreductase [Phycisphaerales bacterium AB-hyl4]|uniref:NAD(P)-dependent oxidoreductase n=1 Tax=Natronomicrosphaera hydrolytica TaxID=3242702 RepID=A0ABV4U2G1_9BACT
MNESIRQVGYIGLGIMGAAMASNLAKAGFALTVWNRTRSKCKPFAKQGATVADSPADLAAKGPDVICLNVTDTADVEQVLFGDDGVVAGAKPGLIVVDHSTISPMATREFACKLAGHDITLVDAPVSGGDVGAREGTLSIMVGGPDDAVQRLQPMFEAVGKTISHLGESGTGQACKACNQIAVVCNLMGVCEAMAMAKKTGLDVSKMLEAIAGGAAGSWQLANLGPRIAKGDFDPGFMIDLVLKDLGIVDDTARQQRLPLAGTSTAEGYFRAVAAAGGGKLGTQAMAKALENLGAVDLK